MKKRKTLPAHDKLNSILIILVQPDMWEEVLQDNVKLGTVYATPEKIETQLYFSAKTELFENALKNEEIWKRLLYVLVWTENILKTGLYFIQAQTQTER